jgi:hypothetical protein
VEASKNLLFCCHSDAPELASKAAQVFAVPPTALPLGVYQGRPPRWIPLRVAFGSTRVPGIRSSCGGGEMNPTELLMDGLDSEDLDPRVAEALPWLPARYPKLIRKEGSRTMPNCGTGRIGLLSLWPLLLRSRKTEAKPAWQRASMAKLIS